MVDPEISRNRVTGAAWRLKEIIRLHEEGKIEWEVVQTALSEIADSGEGYAETLEYGVGADIGVELDR